MGKADYKRMSGKSKSVQDRARHRGIYAISDKWYRWAKKYLSRHYRRNRKDDSECPD